MKVRQVYCPDGWTRFAVVKVRQVCCPEGWTRFAVLLGVYSGTGLESKVCVRATIGLFECISEPNFRSPFAYVCSKPGVSFNTSMWMDHTNKP